MTHKISMILCFISHKKRDRHLRQPLLTLLSPLSSLNYFLISMSSSSIFIAESDTIVPGPKMAAAPAS